MEAHTLINTHAHTHTYTHAHTHTHTHTHYPIITIRHYITHLCTAPKVVPKGIKKAAPVIVVKNEPVGGAKNGSKSSNLSDVNARLNGSGSHEVLVTKRGSNSNSNSDNNSNGNENGENGNEVDEMVMGGYDDGEDMDEGGHMDEDDGDD